MYIFYIPVNCDTDGDVFRIINPLAQPGHIVFHHGLLCFHVGPGFGCTGKFVAGSGVQRNPMSSESLCLRYILHVHPAGEHILAWKITGKRSRILGERSEVSLFDP